MRLFLQRYGLLALWIFSATAVKAEDLGLLADESSEFFAARPEINIASKFVTIIVFLLVFAALAYGFLYFVKSGKMLLPQFLQNKNFLIKGSDHKKNINPYSMNLLERKSFDDGSELWVVELNGRHMLLGKTVSTGFTYLTDLNDAKIPQEQDTVKH